MEAKPIVNANDGKGRSGPDWTLEIRALGGQGKTDPA